jgi:uncharacterized membrane protein
MLSTACDISDCVWCCLDCCDCGCQCQLQSVDKWWGRLLLGGVTEMVWSGLVTWLVVDVHHVEMRRVSMGTVF